MISKSIEHILKKVCSERTRVSPWHKLHSSKIMFHKGAHILTKYDKTTIKVQGLSCLPKDTFLQDSKLLIIARTLAL